MSKLQAINNTNVVFALVLLCRTDKTPCLIRCPKCEITKKGCKHTKAFKKPESVWRHFFQSHSIDANESPNLELCIQALESVSHALKNKTNLNKLELPKKLGMIVK